MIALEGADAVTPPFSGSTRTILFLSQLIRKDMRGRGLARHASGHIDSCEADWLTIIWLTVDKRNPAVGSYGELGSISRGVIADIGGGSVMDDYRMEKVVV